MLEINTVAGPMCLENGVLVIADPQQRRRTLDDELCEKLAAEKQRLDSLKNALTGLSDMLMDFRVELGREDYQNIQGRVQDCLDNKIRESEDEIRFLECRILDIREGTRLC